MLTICRWERLMAFWNTVLEDVFNRVSDWTASFKGQLSLSSLSNVVMLLKLCSFGWWVPLQLKTATSFVNCEQHQHTVECGVCLVWNRIVTTSNAGDVFVLLFKYKSVCITQENRLGIVKEVTGQSRKNPSPTLQKMNNKEH